MKQVALTGVLLIVSTLASAQYVVVTPVNHQGWYLPSTATFVSGPAGRVGSLQLPGGTYARVILNWGPLPPWPHGPYDPILLKDFFPGSYATYVQPGSATARAPRVCLGIQELSDSWEVCFDPALQTGFAAFPQGPVAAGVWQVWDLARGGWGTGPLSSMADIRTAAPAIDYAIGVTINADTTANIGAIELQTYHYNFVPAPSLSISDVSILEPGSDAANAVFTVALTGMPYGSTDKVAVAFATADGTAAAGSDYTATSGVLTFDPNLSPFINTRTISVPILPDNVFEPDETFLIKLSNATNAAIGTATATGTIRNDDPLPSIAIDNVRQNEGQGGIGPFLFSATLSNPSSQTVTVDYATSDGTATSTSDYAAASGTVTFPPLVTAQSLSVNVNGDTMAEPDETFFVNLQNPANATISAAQGSGTIVNDDGSSAGLRIDLTAPAMVRVSSPLEYTINVTNQGPSTATNVLVSDDLPPGLSFVSAVASQGTCSGTAAVRCSLGTLAAGGQAGIILNVMSGSARAAVSNTATVSAAESDPNAADNMATATTMVVIDIPLLSTLALITLTLALTVAALGTMRR